MITSAESMAQSFSYLKQQVIMNSWDTRCNREFLSHQIFLSLLRNACIITFRTIPQPITNLNLKRDREEIEHQLNGS